MLAGYDAPAFMRRARHVEEAYRELLSQCQARRQELAKLATARLATLGDLAGGDWATLRTILKDKGQIAILEVLKEHLQSVSRGIDSPSTSRRVLRRAISDLNESLQWFNNRWSDYLERLDLGPINELREKYNRYYLLEKECLVRSPRVARQGFRPLVPLRREELRELFPPLPIPQLV